MHKFLCLSLVLSILLFKDLLASESGIKSQLNFSQRLSKASQEYLNRSSQAKDLNDLDHNSPRKNYYCLDARLIGSFCSINKMQKTSEQDSFFEATLSHDLYSITLDDTLGDKNLFIKTDFLKYQQSEDCYINPNCSEISKSVFLENPASYPVSEIGVLVVKARAVDGSKATVDPNTDRPDPNLNPQEIFNNTTLGVKYKRRW